MALVRLSDGGGVAWWEVSKQISKNNSNQPHHVDHFMQLKTNLTEFLQHNDRVKEQ